MADDVNANIRIDLDTSEAVVALKNLQAQISSFNQSVIKSNATAVAAQQSMLSTLTAQIGASRQFTTSMVNVETSVSKLGRAIDKNKLTLGEYFRYGAASTRTFGRMFGREHNAIMELAADRVKRLQTQYIAMGEAQNGVTRAMAVRPVGLFNADMAVGIQRQQLFNKLLHDGSTSLINWGKNTQWAGRQLMVGFTVPLTIFGGIAGQIFMDLERQIVNFRRVYGDATTPLEETEGMIDQIKELSSEFTQYGIAVKDTITLASDAAAAGAQGADLLAQTAQATRLATLGMMDQQQALTATIALQSAFRLSATELADAVNFLNAVENQTVVSLQDVAEAIPKVAPVIQGLGGDVQDLAIFLAAMREGGISAAEGANALKSGLASLINPTKNAREQLAKVGIDIDAILKTNKGDLRGIVMEFGTALSTLNKFQRQQTLAKVFGKYQFARLGALFENVSRQGSQAQRVVDLTGESLETLGQLAEKELGAIADSVGVKFTGAVERLKLAIAPIGEAFLRVATPIVEFATKVLEKFNELSPAAKNIAVVLATGLGVIVPTVTMLIGLFANFAGQAIKGIAIFTNFFRRLRGGGASLNYLSEEQLDAMAAAASLEGRVDSLTTALNVQKEAVKGLSRAYGTYVASAKGAAATLPQGFRGPRRPMTAATGGVVPGTGNKDTVPALLTPGESVITKEATQKFGPILGAMNEGKIPGFAQGVVNLGGESISLDIFNPRSVAAIQRMFDQIPKDALDAREAFKQILRDVKVAQEQNQQQLRFSAEQMKSEMRATGQPALRSAAGEVRYSRPGNLPPIQQHLEMAMSAEEAAKQVKIAEGSAKAAAQAMQGFNLSAKQMEEASSIARAHITEADKNAADAFDPSKWQAQSQVENQLSNIIARSSRTQQTYIEYMREVLGDSQIANSLQDKITKNLSLTEAEYDAQRLVLQRMLADIQSGRLAASRVAPGFQRYATGAVAAVDWRRSEGVAYGATTAAAAAASGAAITSMRTELGSRSPSEEGAKVGDDIDRGVAEGIARSTPLVTAAAERTAQQAVTTMRTGAAQQLDLFDQPPIDPQMALFPEEPFRVERRQVPAGDLGMGGGDGPDVPLTAVGGASDDASVGMDKAEKSASRLSSRLFAVSMGATTAVSGLSMMEGKVGETAQSMFPFIMALDAASMGFMLLDGKMGKMGGFLKGFGKPFMAIGTAITAVVSKIPFIGKLGAVFSKLGGIVAKVAAAFMKFSGLRAVIGVIARVAAFLGPQGIIAGIIALGVAVFEIYRKFETFRDAVSSLGSSLVELFEMIFGPTEELGGKMSSLGDTISSVWNSILGVIEPILRTIVKLIEVVVKIVTLLIFAFKQAVNWVSTNFPKIADTVLNSLGPVGTFLRGLGSGIADVFRAIPGAISNAWDAVVKTVVTAINFIIDKINVLIRAANALGAGLSEISQINLAGPEGGAQRAANRQRAAERRKEQAAAIKRGQDAAAARYQAMADAQPEPEDIDLTEEETGAGDKQKTFLQELAEEVNANYRLFVENVKNSGKSAMDQLRAISPPIPEQILAMIGAGPEGLKNAQEFLAADAKKRKELIDKWRKATVGETLSGLRARVIARGEENVARTRLQGRGLEKDLLEEIVQDESARQIILTGTKDQINEMVAGYKLLAEQKDPIDALVDKIEETQKEIIKDLDIEINKQQKVVDGIQDQIDVLEEKNAADQWTIRNKEREKELIDRQIESLERANEMDQRRIDTLQRQDELRNRESEALSRELEQLSLVEDQIRQSYQQRIEALDKVAEINTFIVNQQKQQLGLSQALAEGDIFAATAAAQEMRTSQAEFAQQQMRAGLEQGMQTAIAGLTTAGGLTREQAEKQIANIKEQSYQTSLQIRDIEDQIFARNEQIIPLKDQQYRIDLQIREIADRIFDRETQINKIRTEQLEPAQKVLDSLTNQKNRAQETLDEMVEQARAGAELADVTNDAANQADGLAKAWFEVAKQIDAANKLAKEETANLIPPTQGRRETNLAYADRVARYEAEKVAIRQRRDASVAAALASGRSRMYGGGRVNYKGSNEPPPAQMMGGGKVMRYGMGKKVMGYAAGNIVGAGTRDSIPAMLTPGEFVVRKAMVDKYGTPLLQAINQGAFGMPRFNTAQAEGNVSVKSQSPSNIVAPMYNNYSVNVSVSGTNASADEIANKTIMKIKQMQDMQIRSGRGY